MEEGLLSADLPTKPMAETDALLLTAAEAGPALLQLGDAATGSALSLSAGFLSVAPASGLPSGGQLPLADIAGLSAVGSTVTISYAPYGASDHGVAKKSPIGDTPGCERHRVHAPIEVTLSSSVTAAEFEDFALAVKAVLAAGAGVAATEVGALLAARRAVRQTLLVLSNPASGSGAAARLYDESVAPILRAAGVAAEVVLTTSAGHGGSVVKSMDLAKYGGIVVVSGDGLVSEVLNGLMQRVDWAQAIKMPIGHVPGGSGNGLATSILKACGEEYGVVEAGFVIARGGTQPLDVATCEGTGDSAQVTTPFYAFLSLSWAIVADIDIESEVFRCCGPARFEISTIQRILCLRRYHGKLSYLPAAASDTAGPAATGESSGDGPPSVLKKHLPATLDGELGPDWRTEEGETILFWACNTAWASFGEQQTPDAKLSDGCWQMLTIGSTEDGTSPVSFCEVLNIAEDPASLANQHPNVRCTPVRAFRLEPERTRGCCGLPCLGGAETGHVSVDGEDAAYGTWQVEVHQGLASVLGA